MKKIVAVLVTTILTAGLGFGVAINTAHADEVKVPISEQGANVETPRKGISKAQVRKRFGEPSDRRGPVGQPPISQWVYGNFTVYFEYDHVVHAVVHRS